MHARVYHCKFVSSSKNNQLGYFVVIRGFMWAHGGHIIIVIIRGCETRNHQIQGSSE